MCESIRGVVHDLPVANCDFDGDSRGDFTVWSPESGIFSWIPSNTPWLIYQKQWGFTADIPICADFDGDDHSDFTVYRRHTGEWFIVPHRLSTFVITFQWGLPNDIPIGGDFDKAGRGIEAVDELLNHFIII